MKYYNPATKQVEEWGTNPQELNPEGIKGKTLVPETTALGAGYTPITPSSLEPVSGLPYVNPNRDMFTPSFPTVPETTPTPTPKTDDVSKMIADLTATTGLAGEKAGYQVEQEKAAGLEAMKASEADYTAQLTQLKADYANVENQMQLQAEGRGITAGGLVPITMSEQRKLSIRANTVSALLAATQGKITFAQAQVDRAVSAKYAIAEAERKAKLENLELLLKDPSLTYEQSQRVVAQTNTLKKQEKEEAIKKENSSQIMNWGVELANNPIIAGQLMQIAQSDNPNLEKAFAIYSQNKPKEKEKLDTSIVEIGGRKLLIDNQTGQTIKDLGSITIGGITTIKPATAAQQTTAGYAARAVEANDLLKGFETKISEMGYLKFKLQSMLPSTWQSSEFQQYDQAARNFINAVLRPESGAAIAQSEFDNAYLQYIPRAGDGSATLKQKEDNRRLKIESLKQAAGGAYTTPEELLKGNVQQTTTESEIFIAPDGTEYVKGEDGLYYPK